MLDNATSSVLEEIEKAGLNNSLVNIVGTPNYFASVIDAGSIYVAHCTDGVGSKIQHLTQNNMCDVIGHDVVAMNYNDMLCVGGNPISFQNHITATEKHSHIIPTVIRGIAESCKETFILLTGGETEILKSSKFHISGSLVGIVQKDNLIDGSRVESGDVIIGLESSGVHANGWTIIAERLPTMILPETLVATKIYHRDIMPLLSRLPNVSAIVNITGGGFRNLERIPKNLMYDIYHDSPNRTWELLETKFSHQELYTTFNMGIGMMVIVRPEDVDTALDTMVSNPKVIGKVKDFYCPKVIVNGQEIFFGDAKSYKDEEVKQHEELGFSLTDN